MRASLDGWVQGLGHDIGQEDLAQLGQERAVGLEPVDVVELVREIAEELGVTIEVIGWLTGRVPIGTAYELTVGTARLTTGDPTPTEHDQIRWLAAHELGDVDWLEPDRPFLEAVGAALS